MPGMSDRLRHRAFAGLTACALLGSAAATAGGASSKLDWSSPFFLVEAQDGDAPSLELKLNLEDSSPARITLFVPRGFALYPQRPAGLPVGEAELEAVDYTAGAFGRTNLQGQITAQALDAATEATLQRCSPLPHIAAWKLTLNLLGQPLEVPIAVSRPRNEDPAGAELRLDICPPALPPAGTLLPIASVDLSLWDLASPRDHGAYLWRALVTPVAPDRMTALSGQTFELRSVVPVPQRLTLSGRYSTARHRVVLRGTLREAGRPVAGAGVSITELIRKVTHTGVIFRDASLGDVRTNAVGAYSLRTPLAQTAGFVARTSERITRCFAASSVPSGCRSQTVAGTQSEPITISVANRRA